MSTPVFVTSDPTTLSAAAKPKFTYEEAVERFNALRGRQPGVTIELATESGDEPRDPLAEAFEQKGYTAEQARRMAGLEPAAEAAEKADELDADTRAMVEYYLDRGYSREAAERMAR